MATGTTSLETLPKDPNAIASTTNPVGNGMLNSATTGPSTIAPPVLTNTNATSNLSPAGGAPPMGSESNAASTGYTAALGTAGEAASTHYVATPYTVAPEGLVENRIKGIVAHDSPLMQQARQLAEARTNDRGLLNSSIGTAAGQSAVIGAATPIASADAGSINQAMTNTANAQNAAGQFNAGADNATSQLNANLLSQMNSFNANSQNAAENLRATAQNAQIMSRLDQAQKVQMQQVLNDNQVLLQQNTAAGQLAQQSMTNIANIQTSTTLDAAQKANAVNAQLDFLYESLRATNKLAVETPGQIASLGIQELFTGGVSGSGVTGGQQVVKSSPEQVRRDVLTSAVTAAQRDLPVWGVNEGSYIAGPGKRQSERTADKFRSMTSAAQIKITAAVDALNDFNAKHPA
jgi:hypothetical protein